MQLFQFSLSPMPQLYNDCSGWQLQHHIATKTSIFPLLRIENAVNTNIENTVNTESHCNKKTLIFLLLPIANTANAARKYIENSVDISSLQLRP